MLQYTHTDDKLPKLRGRSVACFFSLGLIMTLIYVILGWFFLTTFLDIFQPEGWD